MEPLPPDDLYKERYLVEEKIGQGGFGKVFLVKDKDGEKCYAAKCIKVKKRDPRIPFFALSHILSTFLLLLL